MSNSIRLSPKHGLNPSITKCFTCGEDYGLLLLGKIVHRKEDGSAIRDGEDEQAPMYVHHGLCKKCEEAIKTGVFIIAVRDGETGDNPYRTGQLICITEEAFNRILNKPIPEKRICFMEETLFMKIFEKEFRKEIIKDV